MQLFLTTKLSASNLNSGINLFSVRQEEDSLDESSETSTQEKPSRKIYYKLRLFPGKWINILYDRLTLLALLDRYITADWSIKMSFGHFTSLQSISTMQLII